MCGISGIAHFTEERVVADVLIDATRVLTHRGPDEEGYFINSKEFLEISNESRPPVRCLDGKGNAGLGHRRLSIIDLASGQQPLCNEDGSIWITFNGEVYNYQILKKELEAKGHVFKTNSDTETLVHAYEEWGEDAVRRFRGMFAFAIWDEKKQELLVARDRLGKKPFYYSFENRSCVLGCVV